MVENTTGAEAEIIIGISKGLSISDIAKHRKVTKQAIYKGIKKLMAKGYVTKTGMVYGLSEQGGLRLNSVMGLNTLRQHNMAIKIKILQDHKNWDKKRNVIMQMPYFNKRVELNNTSYDLLNFGKIKIKTTSQSVILYLPTIFSGSVDEALQQAMEILFDIIPKIENRFKIKLVKDNKINMTMISQEYARLNDAMARIYKREGNKIYITGEDGKIWLIADYSFAIDELETIHPDKAGDDMTAVHTFFNDLRKNPTTFSEVREVASMIQQSQLIFDRNMTTHIKAIQDLSKGVNELREEVKKLGRSNRSDNSEHLEK